ncbi:hypothetical protein [Wolbachia endosymbiont (group A) of Trypoxylon clavicerum]|uniref:hypothetical protein n=1 Tax=Wolbachia endosymbiont (group A) of Trypoxylon clavicerum TaxID=2954064 RepID=UPI0022301C8E|nr:hypothetical protein [Wolbachia endosymbiont (group A) of Trypoxylon clavicerum]
MSTEPREKFYTQSLTFFLKLTPLPEHLPNDEAIENIAKRLQKSIDDAKKHKVMFSVDVFQGEKSHQ